MEQHHNQNTQNDFQSILIIVGVFFLVGFLFYSNKIRPDAIKQRCKDQVYAEVRSRFTTEELATKEGLQTGNWLLNIRYTSCLANKGIFSR